MQLNGIKHSLVAPYHRSNGKTGRFVQTFKKYFKADEAAAHKAKSSAIFIQL